MLFIFLYVTLHLFFVYSSVLYFTIVFIGCCDVFLMYYMLFNLNKLCFTIVFSLIFECLFIIMLVCFFVD